MRDAWRQRSMDELILLTEAEATRLYFDSRNARVLFRLLLPIAVVAMAEALFWLSEGRHLEAGRALASLILIRWLYYLRDRPLLTRSFREILVGYLSVQLLLLRRLELGEAAGIHPVGIQPVDYLLPCLLLLFRLRPASAAIPLAVLWAASSGRHLISAGPGVPDLELAQAFVQTAVSAVVLLWVGRLTGNLERRLQDDWRREHRRFRERSRMREELDDARRIQLSMLPRSDPRISWLDVAGISIPASEVGGDYYDYFTLGESRLSIVIADVAGHGVASALLLSGVRSCLYLLEETPLAPRDILVRLDRMVRRTTGSRSFVTMLYAVFDYEKKELTYSAAGHPPILRYRAGRSEVEELGLTALPLGTALGNSLSQRTVSFEPSDIFLFTTDGIAETLGSRQQLYGNRRLGQRLRDTDHDRTAREIRDTLLGDVWSFKGDVQQTDDITLVVVKVH